MFTSLWYDTDNENAFRPSAVSRQRSLYEGGDDVRKKKAVIRRFYDEVFTAGKMNIAAIDQHLTDDFVGHDLPPGLNGRAGYKKFVGIIIPVQSADHSSSLPTFQALPNLIVKNDKGRPLR